MKLSGNWRTGAMLAGALLVGTMIGAPLANATSKTFVTILGSGNHKAGVSSSGELSVNPHLSKTRAGQLLSAEASPSSFVNVFGNADKCDVNGIYKVPTGKALIVTGVNFYNAETSTDSFAEGDLFAGPSATPCLHLIDAGNSTELALTLSQTFQPGIAVPAGDALGTNGTNDSGSIEVYGYLVPAAAVPASALSHLPLASGRHHPSITDR